MTFIMNVSKNYLSTGELFKWIYETEYKRSFCQTSPSLYWQKEKQFQKPNDVSNVKKCSSKAIQTEPPNKSILKKNSKRPASAPSYYESHSSVLSKELCEHHKAENDTIIERSSGQTQPQSVLKKDTNVQNYARILDLIAGKNSKEYQRTPYIQSRKKVNQRQDSISFTQHKALEKRFTRSYPVQSKKQHDDSASNTAKSYVVHETPLKTSPEKEEYFHEDVNNDKLKFIKTVPELSHYSSLLDIVAGNKSSEYHRVPFIQSKKTVKHKNDRIRLSQKFDEDDDNDIKNNFLALQNEPDIPKKRITQYSKNHNILRTNTIEEDYSFDHKESKENIDSSEDTQANQNGHGKNREDYFFESLALSRYRNYRPMLSPGTYSTSYQDDFTDKSQQMTDSPVLLAEKRLNLKNKLWDLKHPPNHNMISKSFDDTYQKEYDKCRYQTEYVESYLKKTSDREDDTKLTFKTSAEKKKKEDFLDYYKKVLQNRVVAYHPVLENYARVKSPEQYKVSSAQTSVSPNITKTKRPAHYDPSHYCDSA